MLLQLANLLSIIQATPYYRFLIFYIGAYPLFGGILWLTTALFFYFRREREDVLEENPQFSPKVSVVISAHNEEKYIEINIQKVCAMDYPDFEVIYVDDGSKDKTLSILEKYADAGKIRLIAKKVNEGKAMAINDAVVCSSGEVIVVFDADSEPTVNVLRYLVRSFAHPRVGAVAGHPCVRNLNNFLTRLQLIEYTSIIGMIRRSQRIWGRIMAFSGVVFAVRRSAFYHAGGFTPSAATEDIDLTWKLQCLYWDVFYEPNAVCWVTVPHTYRGFIKQRIRWAKGLMNAINRYIHVILHWNLRRMWLVVLENFLSVLWDVALVVLSTLWLLTLIVALPKPFGVSLVPQVWGVTIGTLSIIMTAVACGLEKKYVPGIFRYFFYSVYYPIYYWLLLAVVAVIALPSIIIRPKGPSTWISER